MSIEQPKQLTITLDAEAVADLESYQQALQAWLTGGLSPEAAALSEAVTIAARRLAGRIDEAAQGPQETEIIAGMVAVRLAQGQG